MDVAVVGISSVGGQDKVYKSATPGLNQLFTKRLLNPEATLPAVRQEHYLRKSLAENTRKLHNVSLDTTYGSLPEKAQQRILEVMFKVILPSRKFPFSKFSAAQLRKESGNFGPLDWFPEGARYSSVESLSAADRDLVFHAIVRQGKQVPDLNTSLRQAVIFYVAWAPAMSSTLIRVLEKGCKEDAGGQQHEASQPSSEPGCFVLKDWEHHIYESQGNRLESNSCTDFSRHFLELQDQTQGKWRV